MYVVRCNSKNEFVDSYPCANCLNLILSLKIKRIVFSSTDNNIISTDPKLLEVKYSNGEDKKMKNRDRYREFNIINKK